MKTIGRYYEVSLQSAINNTYEFYVEPASQNMDCDTLLTNQQRLQSMVLDWEGKAISSTNQTEINNANSIVQILQGRLNEYDRIYSVKCSTMTTTNNGTVAPTPEQPTTNGGGSIVLPLLLVAGGIFFISRMKKRRSLKRKR